MEKSEFILVHMIMASSTILPAFLMHFIDIDEPNKLVGYRTKWSMKSEETWKFAQKYSSKLMWWAAAISITVQVFSVFIFERETSIIVAVAVFTVAMMAAIVITERQLRLRFNKDGTPKSNEHEDLI